MSSVNHDLRKTKAFVFGVDGMLSCDVIPLHPNSDPMRIVNIEDGYALQLAVRKGYEVAIITGGYTEAIQVRFSRLGVQYIYVRSAVRVHGFKDFMEGTGLSPEHIVCTGDDIPDYEVITRAGLPVAPVDVVPEIEETAKYISPRQGGEGVARNVVKQTMRAQGHWFGEEIFG